MTTYCFDLDGTLCTQSGTDYEAALPMPDRIAQVNHLFEAGNEILIFTARGSGTGIDQENLTRHQLKIWNVKYHKLILGKPAADFYIDDRAIHSDAFEWCLANNPD